MATRSLLVATATLLLLFSLSPTPTTSQSIVIPDVVFDLSGNPVEYGSEYYIIPVGGSLGGGFTRASIGSRCPLYAVQAPENTDRGAPIKFVPVAEPDRTEVFTQTNLRINSGVSGSCISRGFWKVKGPGPTKGRNEIVAAGAKGIAPANFTLLSANTSPLPVYQILHCFNCDDPSKVSRVVDMLSVVEDNSGMRILGFPAANDVSRRLQVVFVKKTDDNNNAVVFEY